MLFESKSPESHPALQAGQAGSVWSRFLLLPLAPVALTPFSYSVLAELTSRAWYVHYDRLGFEPMPRAQVVRRHKGHAYFNLSLPAQLEADRAGVEPLAFAINGQRLPLATWEKPGFLAGFKLGRAQKRIDDTLIEYTRQLDAITEKARAWYHKTQAIKRWGQAEVLQIMEEIERVGLESMAAFLAARYSVGQHYARLTNDLAATVPASQAALLISQAVGTPSGLIESALLAALAASTGADVEQLKLFLDEYGHRAAHEGEMAHPRWVEDATLPLAAAAAFTTAPSGTANVTGALQALLDKLPAAARKASEQNIQKLRELLVMQSRALHALTYIWAGTRTWALAAAREAMVDKRLHNTDEVFLFELEEIKQMMTGEWNISSLDEIRSLIAKRQEEYAAMQPSSAPDTFVGDTELLAAHQGLAAVAGSATGSLCRWDAKTPPAQGAILATPSLDSGCVVTLPLAVGFVAASGTPCDPFVAVAQAWQRPTVVALGQAYDALNDSASTTLEVQLDALALRQG